MKIKLTRDLWNCKADQEIEIGEDRGTWAINKGYAVKVSEPVKPNVQSDTQPKAPAKNKAIEPKYKRNKIK